MGIGGDCVENLGFVNAKNSALAHSGTPELGGVPQYVQAWLGMWVSLTTTSNEAGVGRLVMVDDCRLLWVRSLRSPNFAPRPALGRLAA
jgi:hypothetical protein